MTSPGRLPPGYRECGVLGRGATSTVVEAVDPSGRTVAVKIFDPELLADESIARRFEREVEAYRSIRHPNIATLHDADPEAGFIVMELVTGRPLAEVIADGPLPPEDIRRIARQLLKALAAAHEAGFVHRDIKPQNIILQDDRARVVDFGIAGVTDSALTDTGSFVGTPAYASPEQLRGSAVDGRSDLYSLGATLFEAATQKRLHAREEIILDPRQAIVDATHDEALAATIGRAVSEHPNDRFADASSFAAALEPPRRKRWRPIAIVAAVVALATIATMVVRPPAEHAVGPPLRVALLPFDDQSGEPKLLFSRAGLPHVLAAELSRRRELEVIGYYALAGRVRDPTDAASWRDAALDAGADVLLAGRLAAAGGRVSIHVGLEPRGGQLKWKWQKRVTAQRVPNAVRDLASVIAADLGRRTPMPVERYRSFEFDRLLLEGVAHLESHQLKEAREKLDRAAADHPDSAELQYRLAILSWWENRPPQETDKHIELALELAPNFSQRAFLEGLRLLERNELAAAIEHFRAARDLNPDDRDLMYGHFESLFHGGRGREAVAVYRRLAKLFPNFRLGAHHVLTFAALRQDPALLEWSRAHSKIDSDPRQAAWRARLAVAAGDYPAAIEALRRTSEANRFTTNERTDPVLSSSLVEAYALAGDVALAQATLESVSEGGTAERITQYGLHLATGAPGVAASEEALRHVLTHPDGQGDPFGPILRWALMKIPEADPTTLEAVAEFTATPDDVDARDPRRVRLRIILAAHGVVPLEPAWRSDSNPELAAAAEAAARTLDADPAGASAQWARAAEVSSDGLFVITSYYLAARAAFDANRTEDVESWCARAIAPRVFHWDWGAVVRPCLRLMIEAKRTRGDQDGAAAYAQRLRRLSPDE